MVQLDRKEPESARLRCAIERLQRLCAVPALHFQIMIDVEFEHCHSQTGLRRWNDMTLTSQPKFLRV